MALREQPGDGDLRWCGALALGDPAQQVDHRQIGLARLGCEARQPASKIAAFKLRARVDRPGEEPPPDRAVGDEADTKLLHGREDFRFGLAPPQGIFALQCRDRLNRMGAADGLYPGFGQAEMPTLPWSISSLTAPATSSIGTSGSTRCW